MVALIALAGASLALIPPVLAHGTHDEQVAWETARIAAEPGEPRHYLFRAEILRLEGRRKEAEADLARAERLDPGLPGVPLCRAALALDGGDPNRARLVLQALLDRPEPPAEAHLLMARALGRLGRQLDAADAYDQAIAGLSRPTPDHYLERARVLIGSGESLRQRALQGLDQGIARLGPAPALVEQAIELELALGRFEMALERHALLRPAHHGPQESWLARQGELLRAAGRPLEAVVAFSQALEAIEGMPPARRATPATVLLEARVRRSLEAGAP